MAIQSFDYCALHYLDQWLEKDRRFVEILKNGDYYSRLFALKEAAGFYRVARTLHTRKKTDDVKERYGDLLRLLDKVNVSDYQSGTANRILDFHRAVRKKYDKDKSVLSLCTKMLWLRIKRPVIIFDANARRALEFDDNVLLGEFYRKWKIEYKKKHKKILAACDRLPARHAYAVNPSRIYDSDNEPEGVTNEDIRKLSVKPWFQERVFDIYLWNKGG